LGSKRTSLSEAFYLENSVKAKKEVTGLKNLKIFLAKRKKDESIAAACERLKISQSAIAYHAKAQNVSLSGKAPPPVVTKTVRLKKTSVEVPSLPSAFIASNGRQAILLIADPETIFGYLNQKGL